MKISKWFSIHPAMGKKTGSLLCLPFAGSGTAFFHSWKDSLMDSIDMIQVHLPGRDARFRETPATNALQIVSELATEVVRNIEPPYAFFGHSMGALLSFELARMLQSQNQTSPCHLFVSGFRAPHLPLREKIAKLPDVEFLDRLREYGGIPELIEQNPELLDLFLPVFRADLTLLENYFYRASDPLNCPVTAFGGDSDPKVSPREIKSWQNQTEREFNCYLLPGGHFFIMQSRQQLMNYLRNELADSFAKH